MSDELRALLAVVGYGIATGALNLLLARRSQVDAWAESRPRIAAILKLLRAIGFDPWMVVQALSLFFLKRLPAASRDPALAPPPGAAPLPERDSIPTPRDAPRAIRSNTDDRK